MLSELSHFPTDNIERVTADMAAKEKNNRSRRAETVSNSIHRIMSAGYYVGFITVFIIPAVVYFVAYFRQIDPTLVDEGGRLIGLVYDFRYPIVFSSVVAALLFVIRWRRRETTRRRETARAAREFSRQFLKTHHEIMLQLMQKNSEDKDLSEDKSIDDFAVILNDIQRFIDSSSNLINNYFRHYTGRECHVSVKSYDPDTDLVYRLSRDSLNPSRNEVDEHHREFNPNSTWHFTLY